MSFGDLTVDVLMSRTNMTRSAFYHYFSGLDEIALGLLDQLERGIHATADAWFEDETGETDYRAAIAARFERMFASELARRTPFAAVAQAASAHQRVYVEWQRRIVGFFVGMTADFIRREVALGRSSVADPDRIARALVLMNDAVTSARLSQAILDSPKQLALTLSEIWNATIYGSESGA